MTRSVDLHSREEACLRAVLCHLSQDTGGPDSGRLEVVGEHFRVEMCILKVESRYALGGRAFQLIDAFHRWSRDMVSWAAPTRRLLGDSIPEM